jgi:xylulose-5-phosphate/fructose-6-phosphate phosphoketolase
VLPILHLNGYKIANPTILARITARGAGAVAARLRLGALCSSKATSPMPMHEAMAAALDAHRAHPRDPARARHDGAGERPRWPMIVLASPKGWTGPKVVDGLQVEGTFRSHQVPLSDPAPTPSTCAARGWLRSYRPEELFDDGRAG